VSSPTNQPTIVPSNPATQVPAAQVRFADKGIRAAGYLIDVVPAIFLGLFGIVPVIGTMISGVLLLGYWLLRDIGGRSLGKLLLGMRVASADGSPAPVGSRILRNVTLAIGPAFLLVPFAGHFAGPGAAIVFIVIEILMLLAQGNRLGDRIAGTTVVKV
jgi:uncharacterized RDD family membrane protein YckC